MQNAAVELFQPEIKLHKTIRFHPDLTFGEKMFLAEVQSIISNNESKKFPFTLRKLSEMFGVSHQTIKNWIKKLVNLGFLEVGMDYDNQEHRQFLKTCTKV